ncbi:MAG: DinB family protein [Chitinophagia bacterium]|nr:DinB family protein [Chitinophagia bacterium]
MTMTIVFLNSLLMSSQLHSLACSMNHNNAIALVVRNWKGQLAYFNDTLGKLTDEQLAAPVAPGKNTGIYLLGHMIAANESLCTLLGTGDKMYPELEQPFIRTPDHAGQPMPDAATLREMWHKSSEALTAQLETLSDDSWLDRHTAVSEADFANEPHRNKLNVVLSRLLHQSYHLGQLALLR